MAEKLTPGPSYIQSEVWIGQVCGGWGGVHWVSGVLNKSYRFWGCVVYENKWDYDFSDHSDVRNQPRLKRTRFLPRCERVVDEPIRP